MNDVDLLSLLDKELGKKDIAKKDFIIPPFFNKISNLSDRKKLLFSSFFVAFIYLFFNSRVVMYNILDFILLILPPFLMIIIPFIILFKRDEKDEKKEKKEDVLLDGI